MSKALNLLEFELFGKYGGICHGISKRTGGCSEGKYNSFNLSYDSGDREKLVKKNRNKLASSIGIEESNLIFPNQCHSNNVVVVQSNKSTTDNTDALITNKKQLAIGVLTADCVPILFFDVKNNVIAAAHSGWRGTVKKISAQVLKEMNKNFGTTADKLIVGIGPGIQQLNYEVGPEVILQIEKLGVKDCCSFIQISDRKGHAYIDLQGLNKQVLLELGVPRTNIEVMNLCTFQNQKLFFSARRDGFKTGRFGSIIMLK